MAVAAECRPSDARRVMKGGPRPVPGREPQLGCPVRSKTTEAHPLKIAVRQPGAAE